MDGVVVVRNTFEVRGQHNWVQFDVDLAPGEHLLTATALEGAASVSETFILDSELYGLLEFWTDPDRGVDPFLRWIIQEEPFGFA